MKKAWQKTFRPFFKKASAKNFSRLCREQWGRRCVIRFTPRRSKVFARLFQKAAGLQRAAPFGRWPQPAERSILQAYLGVWGPLQEKGPQGPSFLRPFGGKRPPRWGGGPAGARGGPSYVFPGSLGRNPLLTASGLMGLEFPAGGAKVDPSPYPPPKGGG